MRSRFLPLAAILFAASTALPAAVSAQTVINPYFLFLLDSSGSMGLTTTCTSGTTNSCGRTCTRMNDAKCALQRVVAGTGDATFGQPLEAWLTIVAVLLVLGRALLLRTQASSWRAAMDAAR